MLSHAGSQQSYVRAFREKYDKAVDAISPCMRGKHTSNAITWDSFRSLTTVTPRMLACVIGIL